MWLPAEVTSDEGCSAATHLCLEFWRGSVSLGIYMLPLADIRQALAGQVREAWTCGIVYKCINLTPFLHCTTNLSGMYDRLVGFQGVKKPKVRRSGLFRRKLQPEPKSQLPQRTKLHLHALVRKCCKDILLACPCLSRCKLSRQWASCTCRAPETCRILMASRPCPGNFKRITGPGTCLCVMLGQTSPLLWRSGGTAAGTTLLCSTNKACLWAIMHQVVWRMHARRHRSLWFFCLTEFFGRESPQQELRWILANCSDGGRTTLVAVFLGVTVRTCF